jgi:acyl-CoA synthetase (AMP-forming)/AMP-acid ligase II
VIGVPDPVYGEEVKACITLREGCFATQEELIDHCLQALPRFKTPKTIAFFKELPKNPVGKILKKDLRKMG